MPIKVRQKKNKKRANDHPQYLMGQQRTWADEYRDDPNNKSRFRRYFVAIIGVAVLILVILISAAINASITHSDGNQQITAADTFAVTQVEQQQMQDYATKFAQGILTYAYCSDQNKALQGKNAALSLMANNTDSYSEIEGMTQAWAGIAPENLLPVITTPTSKDSTQAYAGDFTYEFDGVAADSSVTDATHPNGTFADAGYHFAVTFSYVTDSATNDKVWVITNVKITAKS